MVESENIPVVLLHGWGGSFRNTWQKPGIDALIEDMGRTVVGLDLLGHGSADKPQHPEDYADLAGWLLAQLQQIAPIVDVVAFSLGALTVLDAIHREPQNFRRIILAGIGDGVFETSDPDRHQRLVDALEGKGNHEDTFSQMFVQYANQPENDKIALTAIMKRPSRTPYIESDFAQVQSPVHIVIGDKDFTAPADRLASVFSNGKLHILKNTDHFATTESFSFIDIVLNTLA